MYQSTLRLAELSFYPPESSALTLQSAVCTSPEIVAQGEDSRQGGLGIALGAAASEARLPCLHEPWGSHAPGCHVPLTRFPRWHRENPVLLQVASWIHLLTLAAKPFVFWEGEGQHDFIANFQWTQ